MKSFDFKPKNKLEPHQGRILIADPFMLDPYFQRTVVFLCEHNSEGTFGFIMNRFVDFSLSQILDREISFQGQVGLGGPVESSSLYFLHELGDRIEGSKKISGEIYLGGDFEQLSDLLENGLIGEGQVRFFAGYSGWEGGQLDNEIEGESWYVANPGELPLMADGLNDLWTSAIKSMGSEFAGMANFPLDPSLN